MRAIGMILSGVLLVMGALVHGKTTHRWGASAESESRCRKLQSLVVQTGDYQAEEFETDQPLKEKSTATSRRYFSATRNQQAIVTIITGPAGSVTTHTPDVCYVASGYTLKRAVSRETVELPGLGKASYYVADFEKKTATTVDRQRVRWSWSDNGQWQAPDRPRMTFMTWKDVAKIYIATPISESEGKEDSLAVKQFLAATLTQYAGVFTGRE